MSIRINAIKHKLSDNDLKKQIVDYMLMNNIKKACWTIDDEWINVRTITWINIIDFGKELIGRSCQWML